MERTFYHFTHRQNLEGILAAGVLQAARPILKGKPEDLAVSLTTDPDHTGHGLPDGRKITAAEAVLLRYYTDDNGAYRCVDNTEFRLELKLLPSPALKPAESMHSKRDLLGLAIAGYLPCSPQPTDIEFRDVLGALQTQRLKNKAPTWWYHFGDLPLTSYRVHHKNKAGGYDLLAKDKLGQVDLSAIPLQSILSL
ncbi:hypothetical protein [Burkholderia cenocepacia]|uniref:hypothetical protein n=1 Tax=Burkholderia cenocepacia TaxID=95486 RepID=UPI0012AECDF2|nr:hypothetical protein [Burkholderia cenocepacia]